MPFVKSKAKEEHHLLAQLVKEHPEAKQARNEFIHQIDTVHTKSIHHEKDLQSMPPAPA